jgi:hypothetical protein
MEAWAMISDQLDKYPGHERFVHAVLGLLSTCDTFVSALQHEARDAGQRQDGPLVDFALGVVSLTRTLRAVLSMIPSAPGASATQAGAELIEESDIPRWLR